MVERRALIEGLSAVEEIDRKLEEEFVYENKPPKTAKQPPAAKPAAPAPEVSPVTPPAPHPQPATDASSDFPFLSPGRVAIGARVRTELAAALKRTSLERQLKGIEPFAVQDILEEALELWLHKQGLLK
jgi:hypothetical protein